MHIYQNLRTTPSDARGTNPNYRTDAISKEPAFDANASIYHERISHRLLITREVMPRLVTGRTTEVKVLGNDLYLLLAAQRGDKSEETANT